MHRIVLAVASGVCMCSVLTSANAADLPVKARPAPFLGSEIVRSNNQLSLSFIATNFHYEEFDPALIDSEKGWVPGFSVGASVMRDLFGIHNAYVHARFNWLRGETNYWSAALQQKSGAEVREFDLRLGKGIDLSATTMLTPYFGTGARWWTRTLRGAGGYSEVYSHGYAGGGLLFQMSPAQRLVLSLNGLVGGTFGSHLRADPTPGGAPITPFDVALGNSAIFMVGGNADYAITQNLRAHVGAEWVGYKYGRSDLVSAGPIVGLVYEPDSRTSNVTVRAGLGYSF